MKYILLTAIYLLSLNATYAQKKYLEVKPLNIVLIRKNDHLLNDSAERKVIKSYFKDAWRNNDYAKVDTIVKLIGKNKDFFIGMDLSDLTDIIGYPLGGKWGADHFFYVMDRNDMPPAPKGRVILLLKMEDHNTGRIERIMTPYNSWELYYFSE